MGAVNIIAIPESVLRANPTLHARCIKRFEVVVTQPKRRPLKAGTRRDDIAISLAAAPGFKHGGIRAHDIGIEAAGLPFHFLAAANGRRLAFRAIAAATAA